MPGGGGELPPAGDRAHVRRVLGSPLPVGELCAADAQAAGGLETVRGGLCTGARWAHFLAINRFNIC